MTTNSGQFKKGQHWRKPREHWEKAWLEHEYVENGRSAAEIAAQQGITENGILHWLHKHEIPVRTVAEARAKKHWGAAGEANGMAGKRGEQSATWRGGITPERQMCYSRLEWAVLVEVVWDRDGGRCQRCRCQSGNRRRIHIHHLIPFGECSEAQRVDPEMCLLLCSKCHGWVHSKHNVTGDFFLKGGGTSD